jgi:hypothetical protein
MTVQNLGESAATQYKVLSFRGVFLGILKILRVLGVTGYHLVMKGVSD